MPSFHPYIIVKSNVEFKYLYYSIKIFNTATNKLIKQSSNKDLYYDEMAKFPLNKNYLTKLFQVDTSYESAKDMTIQFNLFRLNGGKFIKIIENRAILNSVSDFTLENIKNKKIKNNIVEYMETKEFLKTHKSNNNPNLVTINLNNKRIFNSIQHPEGDVKDPFTKEKVQLGLMSRLKEKYPDQGRTNLCGPAAFFYCVLNGNPQIYKKIVKELWETGSTTVNKLTIKPDTDGARTVKNFFDGDDVPAISAVDWITMGSLRDSANLVFDYTLELGESPTAISYPGDVIQWFDQIGFESSKLHHIGSSMKNAIFDTSNYDAKDYFIVLLSSSSILYGQKKQVNLIPTHWVVLESNITANGVRINSSTSLDELVSYKVFSWGKSYQPSAGMTLRELMKYTWGVYIYKRAFK